MKRINVQSTNIKSIWYENWILEVEFHHGWVYQYSWVSENEYLNLLNANSVGSYFSHHIKSNYSCVKVW